VNASPGEVLKEERYRAVIWNPGRTDELSQALWFIRLKGAADQSRVRVPVAAGR
jgi:hypothetical protein